jgi:hypothetical protein
MQQVMQFAAGTVLCFALIGYWDDAIAQQPIARRRSIPRFVPS